MAIQCNPLHCTGTPQLHRVAQRLIQSGHESLQGHRIHHICAAYSVPYHHHCARLFRTDSSNASLNVRRNECKNRLNDQLRGWLNQKKINIEQPPASRTNDRHALRTTASTAAGAHMPSTRLQETSAVQRQKIKSTTSVSLLPYCMQQTKTQQQLGNVLCALCQQ